MQQSPAYREDGLGPYTRVSSLVCNLMQSTYLPVLADIMFIRRVSFGPLGCMEGEGTDKPASDGLGIIMLGVKARDDGMCFAVGGIMLSVEGRGADTCFGMGGGKVRVGVGGRSDTGEAVLGASVLWLFCGSLLAFLSRSG